MYMPHTMRLIACTQAPPFACAFRNRLANRYLQPACTALCLQMPEADGFVFGFPTRFGSPAAQFKAFFDATGQHWQKGSLFGKPFGVFTSTATQNGGQETTVRATACAPALACACPAVTCAIVCTCCS